MSDGAQKSGASATRGRPFAPGTSGNPGGRPRLDPEVVEALRAANLPAARRLAMLSQSMDDDVALKACLAILDRNGHKPTDKLELSEDPDSPVNPLRSLTVEELKAVARAQLEKER